MQITSSRTLSTIVFPFLKPLSSPFRPFSSSTPYPLYYKLIHYRPNRRHPNSSSSTAAAASSTSGEPYPMDRSKRRYYRKRQRRMYGDSGSDSDTAHRSDFVELKPEIVDFPRLHSREQELFFHDAFALPWEKDKHYRMVYQLEKKFFPEHSFDNAFVDPAEEVAKQRKKGKRAGKKEEGEKRDEKEKKDGVGDVSEKKVGEFFKFLKKVPNAGGRSDVGVEDGGGPFL